MKMPRGLREYMEKTCEDTMQFMEVALRRMRVDVKRIQDKKVAEGFQMAIDYLEEFVQNGRNVVDKVVQHKTVQLEKAMEKEMIDANVDVNGKKSN